MSGSLAPHDEYRGYVKKLPQNLTNFDPSPCVSKIWHFITLLQVKFTVVFVFSLQANQISIGFAQQCISNTNYCNWLCRKINNVDYLGKLTYWISSKSQCIISSNDGCGFSSFKFNIFSFVFVMCLGVICRWVFSGDFFHTSHNDVAFKI